jgi:membrane protein
LWLIASALFSWYVSSFGSYNETYGSVAAIAVFMMWLWLSAFAVLIGGEVNAELEAARKPPRPAAAREP